MEKVAPALEVPAVAAEQGTAGSEEEEAATEAATAKTVEGKVDANEVVTASVGGESGQANGADGQAQNAAATKIQARARGARDRQRLLTIKDDSTAGAAATAKQEETAAAEEQDTGVGTGKAAAASASAPAELAGEAAIWQQMTDEASGKPYWSLTRCVLPDDRARLRPPSASASPRPCPACRQHVTGAMRAQQVQRKDRPVLMDPTRGRGERGCGENGACAGGAGGGGGAGHGDQ